MKSLKNLTILAGCALALSMTSVAKAPAAKDIVDTAVDSKSFPTLVSLLQKAELVETLKGTGPFTVFAPSEAAFKKLDKKTLNAVLTDNALLKKVLLYHVVAGKVMAADVVKLNGKEAKTAGGSNVKIKVDSHGAVMVNKSKVIKTDIVASNGVIHVIDTVLIPPAK